MPIPIPDLPGQPSTAPGIPLANVTAASAPANALGSVAKSIASVGDAFQEHADQVQKRENASKASEFRLRLTEDYAELQQKLAKDPTADHVEQTRLFFREARSRADSPDLPPAVRDELKSQVDADASRATIGAAASMARVSEQRAVKSLDNERAKAVLSGDREAHDRALATGRNAGIILPEDEDRLNMEFDRRQSTAALEAGIAQDPDMVLEDIGKPDFFQRMPGLGKADLPQIKKAIEAGRERKREDELDTVQLALKGGQLTGADLEASLYLNPLDIAAARVALQKQETAVPPTNAEHAAAWSVLDRLRAARNNAAVSDTEFRALFNDTRRDVLQRVAPQWQGDLAKELNYLSPSGRKLDDPPKFPSKDDLVSQGTAIATRAMDAGLLGETGPDVSPEKAEKTARRFDDVRLEIKRWVNTEKEPTVEGLRAFTDALISNQRAGTNAADLRQFVPGGGQKFLPAPAMPPLPGTTSKGLDQPLIAPGAAGSSDALLPPKQQLDQFLDQ